MASLAQLKKKKGSNLKQMQEKLAQADSGAPRDERIWKPKFNAEKGQGSCKVRFLPAQEGENFVELMEYSFNGPGGNYYDLARQTIGEDDPIQIASINMFKKNKADPDKALYEKAKTLLPKRKYYANVYVIKDTEAPDNEGKVFIWQFGPAIFNILKETINPKFDDQEPIDPFDLWEGADFNIRMEAREMPDSRTGKKITVPNYDKSSFAKQSEFMDGDEEVLDELYQKTYDLSEFVDPAKFKSFEAVAAHFKKVTGKDFRHYDPTFVGEHVKEEEEKREHESKTDYDDGSDNHREENDDDQPPFDTEEDDGDDDESPLDRFKRLAKQS